MTLRSIFECVAVAAAGGLAVSGSALAGAPIPAPLAGAAGPVGLVAVGVAYVGYRAYRRFKKDR